jgi:hypothetical protein
MYHMYRYPDGFICLRFPNNFRANFPRLIKVFLVHMLPILPCFIPFLSIFTQITKYSALQYARTYLILTYNLSFVFTPPLDAKLANLCRFTDVVKSNNQLVTIYVYVISGFRREVDETCTLLGYFAAYGGNSLPTFRDN